MNEFSPYPQKSALRYHPRELKQADEQAIISGLQIKNAQADHLFLSTETFQSAVLQTETVNVVMDEIQKNTLKTLAADGIRIDEATSLEDALDSLAASSLAVREIKEAIERESWRPNLWKLKVKDLNPVGFQLLTEYARLKKGPAAINPRSHLEELLSRRPEGRYSASNKRNIKEACEEISRLAQSPEVAWTILAEKNVIPKELLENTDALFDMFRIYKLSTIAENTSLSEQEKSLLKARVLLPFIEKGANPLFIEDIVKGDFIFDEHFFKTIVEGIAGLAEEAKQPERPKKRWGGVKKAVIAATLVGTLTAAGYYAFSEGYISVPPQISEFVSSIGIEIPPPGKAAQNLPEQERDLLDPKSIPEREDKSIPAREKTSRAIADTVDANSFIRGSRVTVWNIEGDASGYYKQTTASIFGVDNQPGWYLNEYDSNLGYDVKFEHSNTIISKKIQNPEGQTSIRMIFPIKDDSFVNTADIKISDSKGNPLDFRVIFHPDGTYSLDILSQETIPKGEEISVRIGMTKVDKNHIPENLQRYLDSLMGPKDADFDRIVIAKDLPDDVRKVVDELNANSNLTKKQKAQIFTEWWKRSSLYSLDVRWSSFYGEADNFRDYFHRIFDKKRVTCDGANTALVMALRAMDIPARNVTGFMNSGLPIFPNLYKLTGNKSHSWVEAWLADTPDSQPSWVHFDGTPSKLDPISRKALVKLLLEGGLAPDMAGELSTDQLREELLRMMATMEELYQGHGMDVNTAVAVAIEITYFSAAIAISSLRNRLRRRYDVLETALMSKFSNSLSSESNEELFINTVKGLFKRFALDSQASRGDRKPGFWGGFWEFIFQPLGLRTLVRLPRYERKMARMEKAMVSLPEPRGIGDTARIVAAAAGVNETDIERIMFNDNRADILSDLRRSSRRTLIKHMVPENSVIANELAVRSDIYVEEIAKGSPTLDDFYRNVANTMYRTKINNCYKENAARSLANVKRREEVAKGKKGVTFETPIPAPEMTKEAFEEFYRTTLADEEFVRFATIYWKTFQESQNLPLKT